MRLPMLLATAAFAAAAFVASADATAADAAEPAGRVAVPTCPGRGYVPYAHPAFGGCPCGEDGCFHPRPYYACCGDADPEYKKAFRRRWLRAHFRGGSMLDGVPCRCVDPPGRTFTAPAATAPAAVAPALPTEESVGEDDTREAADQEKAAPAPAGGPSPPAPGAADLDESP